MHEQPSSPKPSTTEQILDLLLDALLERQADRQAQRESIGPDLATKPPVESETPPPSLEPGVVPRDWERSSAGQDPRESTIKGYEPSAGSHEKKPDSGEKPASRELRPGDAEWTAPPRLPSINLGRTLGRLLLALVVLVVLVNVPVNRHGTSLARIMPDTAALVIRDGLVLKGSGPEIYVLENNQLRWISSLEAFEFFGYRWEQVHIVDDNFLGNFEKGQPLHVLLKCDGSPHIYALENGQKRWIKDISTFEAEGYVWDDVKMVACSYLRGLPDGPPIPADAGPPPKP
jgi:hypothetical protein